MAGLVILTHLTNGWASNYDTRFNRHDSQYSANIVSH